MYYLMAQPSNQYFQWQLEVVLRNMKDLGVDLTEVILLFTKDDPSVPIYIQDKYPVKVFTYDGSKRASASKWYIPSIRPYLWYRFLDENPEYTKERFVYQDSDIIYKELLDFDKLPNLSPTHWYGGNVESYVGPTYLNSKGTDMLERIGRFFGLSSVDDMWNFKGRTIGAQWVIDSPTVDYWKDVYEKSYGLYDWLKEVEHEYDYNLKANGGKEDYYVQIWCAEMYAELYLCAKYNIMTEASHELDFAWSTDTIDSYNRLKILHNAGVTPEIRDNTKLFFKGDYQTKSPLGEDLSWVNKDYSSKRYAEAIEKVRDN